MSVPEGWVTLDDAVDFVKRNLLMEGMPPIEIVEEVYSAMIKSL